MEARGYKRFPLSKAVVGQNIASRAVPAYRASTYLVSAFLALSTSFSINVFNPKWWNVLSLKAPSAIGTLISSFARWNVYFSLVVGIHFVSPGYDTLWLTGCKTSNLSVTS